MTKKRVEDLSVEELDAIAREAWGDAAKEAFSHGLPITGSREGRRFRYYPDGRIEDLGPIDAEVTATLKAGE